MNKRLAIVLLVIAQLSVPTWMIASQENILNKGSVYKFKTVPVDPYDIFRGRYVALRTDQRFVKMQNSKNIARGHIIYAMIANDSDGFAQVKSAMLDKPASGDYIKVKVRYKSGDMIHFNFPFDRYYMNEKKAPKAEVLYRSGSRREKQDAYVLIRILKGSALIEDLYVGGKSIKSYF